ncbi:hypothetical protein ACCT20_03435 [Rhizobium ruizarguesonis]|uniref:hypothetical protein n=1 Tax=Rhizobium TaxID=379 RepID=UPI0010322D60|nr:hypothetical protein [Rhizobium ruizarguesonis]TBA37483.1 hypothetical protein ELH60_08520 [Rhizobium ruizarguesonis]TBC62830.1 hypothetical protein ELH36_08530 [Rhizobium ruizarguesonis]TBD37473.1 hypothetical protein ELH18_08355 [Rhizobium ruizarguesonis]
MARVGYDSLEGILRVTSAGDKEPDKFVVDVLTYHAALEIEMDELLARLLPRAECLRAGGLGFRQKISIINAAWPGLPEAGDLWPMFFPGSTTCATRLHMRTKDGESRPLSAVLSQHAPGSIPTKELTPPRTTSP